MLAGKVPFTADNPVTLVFKHVHEDVPDITTACPGINAGVAAFLARLTARAVEDRPQDASVAFDELQQLQSNLTIDDWQYRLSAVSPAANDAADTMPGDGTRQMPLPPAPPAPPVRQNDDRTRQFNPENPNKTTVMPAQQADPEATTRLALEKNDVPAKQRSSLPPRTVRSVVDSRNAVASVHLSSSPS